MNVSKYILTIPVSGDEYILVNTLTGAVDSVDKDTVKLLQAIDKGEKVPYINETEGVLRTLSERGYLTDNSMEEEIRSLENRSKILYSMLSKCISHHMIVTYDCNLRCRYCFETSLRKHGVEWLRKTFSEEEVDILYDAISSLDKDCTRATKTITLFGGEPLLPQNIEIVKYIMRKGLKLGYTFNAVTNGVSLKDYASDLKKEGLEEVQVTLDGVKDIHDKRRYRADGSGTFNDIVEGVEEAKEKMRIYLRVTLDSSNFDRVGDLLHFIMNKGWHREKNIFISLAKVVENPGFEYSPVMPRDEATLKMMDLFASNEEYRFLMGGINRMNPIGRMFFSNQWRPLFNYCGAGRNLILYDPHGNMYCCYDAVGVEEHIIGKFKPKLEFNETYKQWQSRNVFNIPACRTCKYATLCGSGCAIKAYYQTGSIMTPNCAGLQNYIEKYIASMYTMSKSGRIKSTEYPKEPP